MLKRIQPNKIINTVKKGVDVYYFEPKENRFVNLEKLLETLPGVFVVDDKVLAKAFEPKPEAPKPEPKPKVAPRAKGIDTGKVIALRRAGWTMAAIGKELGVSAAAVKYHLDKMENLK